jgi:malonate-semialdehyde dehydrogenase (acetylating)/methylmalonate-semialdehyde dehydrogenase
MKYPAAQHFIGGTFTDGAPPFGDVHDPSPGQLIAKVPLGGRAEVDAAVAAARRAFPAWSRTPMKERVQVFYRYRSLLERNLKELRDLIAEEHGKLYGEAEAEVLKAMELTEFACSLPQIAAG